MNISPVEGGYFNKHFTSDPSSNPKSAAETALEQYLQYIQNILDIESNPKLTDLQKMEEYETQRVLANNAYLALEKIFKENPGAFTKQEKELMGGPILLYQEDLYGTFTNSFTTIAAYAGALAAYGHVLQLDLQGN